MGGPFRPYACRTSLALSQLKTGDYSNSTSRSVSPPSTRKLVLVTNFAQSGFVHTIQDALALIPLPQPVQVGQSSSSMASQQVLLDALPPVLVLHLERFVYDATAGGMAKINKPIEFSPELEIPPGMTFSFLSLVVAEANDPS